MKLRLCSWLLLLVCVFSFVLSSLSHTVYADDIHIDNIEDNEIMVMNNSYTEADMSLNYYMATTDYTTIAWENIRTFAEDWQYPDIFLISSFTLNTPLGSGEYFDLQLRNAISGINSVKQCIVILYDSNWKSIASYDSSYDDNLEIEKDDYYDRYNYYLKNLSSDKSVKYIRIYQRVNISAPTTVEFTTSNYNLTIISQNSKLNSIIHYISSIFTGITNLPQNIANSIKGFFDNIVNAVTNIGNIIKNAIVDLGNFLIDGIKNLFVPTQEDIQEYTDKWSELLADRFGCLYEVVDMVSEYVESFKSYNERGTINIPVVTLDFGGVPFELGGWSVNIVPSGFEFLFDALKIAIDMVCTIAFINGLKRRYDVLMERG